MNRGGAGSNLRNNRARRRQAPARSVNREAIPQSLGSVARVALRCSGAGRRVSRFASFKPPNHKKPVRVSHGGVTGMPGLGLATHQTQAGDSDK
jgi:hypothetical protein